MLFKTTFAQTPGGSPADNARAAAAKIAADFAGFNPATLLFFAATDYDPETIAAEMQAAFPGATTMGCSSHGEMIGDKVMNRSVVAMAFAADAFAFSETAIVIADRCAAHKIDSPDVFSDATAAMRYLARNLDTPLLNLDHREYVGFALVDAVAPFVESVIDRAGEMTNVFMTGAVAADEWTFDRQYVFYKGRAYRNGAAVLALWKPANGFELLKTQAVEVTKTRFIVTKADEERRIIREFDGRNALEAYAEAIGVPADQVGVPEFGRYPLALTADGEPFLTVFIGKTPEGGLQMYNITLEGMRLTLTKSVGILESMKEKLDAKIAETGMPAAILNINCSVRHDIMSAAGVVDDFGRLFADVRVPHVGLASFGEIYVNLVGITSVIILFK